MDFEWHEVKAKSNYVKHGIMFSLAARVFLDLDRIERRNEGANEEERWETIGAVDGVELFVVFTFRGRTIRLISARRAERYEREEYWNRDV